MLRRMSLVCLLVLAGCPELEVVPDPVPEPAPELQAGAYDLVIHGVVESSCGEMPPVEAQALPAQLGISGREARLDVAGLLLEGRYRDGELVVEGGYDVPVGVEEDVPGTVEAEEDADSGAEAGAPPDEGGDDPSVPPEGRDCGDEPVSSDDPSGDAPPGDRDCGEPDAVQHISLSASVIEPNVAEGELLVELGRCAVELSVTLGPARDREEPVVVEEESDDVVSAER